MLKASIGTVSHGTLRSEDLLRSFAAELEHHVDRNLTLVDRDMFLHFGHWRDLVQKARETSDDDIEACELVCELADALQTFAPDGCYFGAHPGDGADFGFWEVD